MSGRLVLMGSSGHRTREPDKDPTTLHWHLGAHRG